jgi:4-amino-4-deoxy-L-arabinose transferase-like glycosyltransferase
MASGDILQTEQPHPRRFSSQKIEWSLLAGVSFILSLIAIAIHHIPLGHDESVYALRGHDLRNGSAYLSGDYWRDYRAPGLSYLDSWLFNIFGENDFVARLPSMFFGVLLFLSTYLLAKELFGSRVAQIAAVLFVATPSLVLNSAYLLADVPGSSIALSCVLLVFYLQRIKANHFFVMACIFVLGSIATTLRFGSFITYGSGIFGASIYFLLARRHEPNVVTRLFNQVTLQFISLFSFVWIYFTHVTSINGKTPFEANSHLASGAGVTPLNGLLDLIGLSNPFSLLSVWLFPIVGVLTLGSFLFAVGNLKSESEIRLQTLGVLIAGLLSLLLLVVGVRYVQENYLVLSAPYWVILSASGFDFVYQTYLKRFEPKLDRVLKFKVLPVSISLLLICLPIYYFASSYMKSNTTRFGVRAAGEAIRSDANNGKCLVISSYPQSAWYSKCLLGIWSGTTEDNPTLGAHGNDFYGITLSSVERFNANKWKKMRDYKDIKNYRKYVVLVAKGKRQPSDESIQKDHITLLTKNFTTDRVFYAEINPNFINVP